MGSIILDVLNNSRLFEINTAVNKRCFEVLAGFYTCVFWWAVVWHYQTVPSFFRSVHLLKFSCEVAYLSVRLSTIKLHRLLHRGGVSLCLILGLQLKTATIDNAPCSIVVYTVVVYFMCCFLQNPVLKGLDGFVLLCNLSRKILHSAPWATVEFF